MHNQTIHLRSRRFFVAVAVTLAALLMLGVSTAVRSAQSATPQPKAAAAATTANRAFSGFHDGGIAMPSSLGNLVTLKIPAAGSYVINAKLVALNNSTIASVNDRCRLTAGGNFDEVRFDLAGNDNDDTDAVALQVVHSFSAPGSVTLSCTDLGKGDVIAQLTKITAVEVGELSDVQI
jgi:hypothetical protein